MERSVEQEEALERDRASKQEAWTEEVRETVANEVRDLIRARRRGEQVDPIAASVSFADRNILDISHMVNQAAQHFGLPGIACGAGCSACCYMRVSILAPEAFAIARYLSQTRSDEELLDLRSRLREYADSIAALPVDGRMRHILACPLLGEDGRCTIYAARPLACRMHHSLSRDACEDRAGPIPYIEDFATATVPVMEGIYNGCVLAEAESPELEYVPALLIALEDKQAEERWYSGEKVFEGAVDLYLREYVEKLVGKLNGDS